MQPPPPQIKDHTGFTDCCRLLNLFPSVLPQIDKQLVCGTSLYLSDTLVLKEKQESEMTAISPARGGQLRFLPRKENRMREKERERERERERAKEREREIERKRKRERERERERETPPV
jgi:hypothetical protein